MSGRLALAPFEKLEELKLVENIGNVFYFQWEQDLLHWIQGIRNPMLDSIVPKITSLANYGRFWVAVVFLLLIIPKHRKLGLQCTIAIAISVILCNIIIKPLAMRARPCWLEPDLLQLIKSPKDYSIPSGHTNISFVVAASVFSRNKKLGIPLLVIAALIGFSRMYVFVHWPTDILCGMLTGVIGAISAYMIVNYINKRMGKTIN